MADLPRGGGVKKHFTSEATGGIPARDFNFGPQSNALTTWPQVTHINTLGDQNWCHAWLWLPHIVTMKKLRGSIMIIIACMVYHVTKDACALLLLR